MVALPPVNSMLSARLRGTYNGQPWINGIHLQYSGTAPTVADLNTLAAAIASAWATDVAPLCNPLVSLTLLELTDLTSAFASQTSAATSQVGTRTGTPLPTSIAMVASQKINFRYRGGHPRIYVPAGNVADVTNGHLWAGAFITAATTGMNAFLAALNAITVGGTTFKVASVHYRQAKAILPTPEPFTVQTIVIHDRLASHRSRLGKPVA